MICSFNDLRDKEVINLCDGTRLGYVCDINMDLCEGKICALLLPRDNGLFSISKCEPLCIPWEKIERIGGDFIFVSVPTIDAGREKKNRF